MDKGGMVREKEREQGGGGRRDAGGPSHLHEITQSSHRWTHGDGQTREEAASEGRRAKMVDGAALTSGAGGGAEAPQGGGLGSLRRP